MSDIRKRAIAGLGIGDTFTVSRRFTEADMMGFGDISRDYNPVHYEDQFAQVKNFKGRICHGLLVASLLTEIGGQMGWLASEMAFKFKNPVYFEQTITCRLTIIDMDERGRAQAEAVFTNQNGRTVLKATLAGIVPGPKEKQVMQNMLANGDPTNKLNKN